MRCLYCGKELALFKRLRGGEFCSDAHRQRYQEEYTQLALNRLLQANSPQELKDSQEKDLKAPLGKTGASANGKEAKPDASKRAEPIESPAIRRRERLKSDDASVPNPLGAGRTPVPEPLATAAHFGTANTMVEDAQPTATIEKPSPERVISELTQDQQPEQVFAAGADEAPAAEPEIASPDMAGLLVEVPVPVFGNIAEMRIPEANFSAVTQTSLPSAQEMPAGLGRELGLGGNVDCVLPEVVDWLDHRQRALEVREFVRSVPVLDIVLKPVGEADLPHLEETLEITFEPHPVEPAATLWQESYREFPPLVILFQEITFEPTSWGETDARETGAPPKQNVGLAPQQPLSAQNVPTAVESLRMEPIRVDPVHFESPRPRAVHFEAPQVEPALVDAPGEKAPTAESIAPPIPEAVTRPEPVTLHGIAPSRVKLMQIFASLLPRSFEIQTPRQSSLPLRPLMVFAPGPASPAETKTAEKVVRPAGAPEKQDPRGPNGKRKPEVRVIALPVKTAAKSPQPTPVKAPEVKSVEAKLGNGKLADAKLADVKPAEVKQADSKQPVRPSEFQSRKEDTRKVSSMPQEAGAPAETARPFAAAAASPDLLGLPTLSLDNSGGFWSRIPTMLRIGIIAAVLTAAISGIILTSRGSSATTAGNAKSKANRQTVVEAGPALANAGWVQDWFSDPRGSKLSRHVDVLRGSLALRDYRLEMEGQIDQGAIGWVFRANNKSFYAEKVAIVTPGLEPTVALVRITVVDGKEVAREQVPLPLKVHLDTLYKIRLDAVGHRFTTFVQDQQVDEWNDSRIEAGGAGLYYDGGESAHLTGTLNVIPLKEK